MHARRWCGGVPAPGPAALLLVLCAATGGLARAESASGAGGAALEPGDQIIALVSTAKAREGGSGTDRRAALAGFRRAAELADAGPPASEDETARRVRYRSMLGGGREGTVSDARLAELLDAVAMARFHVAEEVAGRARSDQLPRFQARKGVPPEVMRWLSEKQGPAKAREWSAAVGRLAPGERDRQRASVQYQHWVERTFVPWQTRSRDALDEATRLHGAVAREGVPRWTVASSERVGDLHAWLGETLLRAPVDPSIGDDPALTEIYRNALTEAAHPFLERASEAYRRCAELSSATGAGAETGRTCEAKRAALAGSAPSPPR